MDDSVIRAMARWPNVPAVYGWLSLDRRGRWCLRGEPITHSGAIAFINRNYARTADGCWYFQNGPQRAYVDLDYTPWIFLLDGRGRLVDHVGGRMTALRGAWLDEQGSLLLHAQRGIGLVCDRDLAPVSDALRTAEGRACDEDALERLIVSEGRGERVYLEWGGARIQVGFLARAAVPARFDFVPSPRGDAQTHVP